VGGAGRSGYDVAAAGGVVTRPGSDGIEVLLVHRPRYDDWSLPKGKLEKDESFEDAALREIEEETGLRCSLGAELEPAVYTDHKGRSKVVRWWRMTLDSGSGADQFEPNDEVDELRWLSLEEAADLVTYDHDRSLIAGLAQAPS
jgi:8-oxo-dGTP diphosphatase